MSKNRCIEKNPLQHGGTSQEQRFPEALAEDYIHIDERSISDLLTFTKSYAQHIKFIDVDGNNTENWEAFFDFDEDKILAQLKNKNDFKPQFALFLCFLKLFEHLQEHVNSLTGKHLDYYYEQVLQLKKSAPQPDQVHILFELAKNANEQLIASDTVLLGPKDANGEALKYNSKNDLVVNKATIDHIRSMYIDAVNQNVVKYATHANSLDGLGEALNDEQPAWKAFGRTDLPEANMGFALASPILLLKSGKRSVTTTIQLSGLQTDLSSHGQNLLSIYLSGEKEWLGPFTTSAVFESNDRGNDVFTFDLDIGSSEEPIVAFDGEVLDGKFQTSAPVMRVLFNKKRNFNPIDALKNAIVEDVKLNVLVDEVTEIDVENDLGKLDSSKPYMPFGPQPKNGSTFYINYDEVNYKNIDSAQLKITWLDPPSNFNDYYKEYDSNYYKTKDSSGSSITGIDYTAIIKGIKEAIDDLNPAIQQLIYPGPKNSDFTVTAKVKGGENEEALVQNNIPMFNSGDATQEVTIDIPKEPEFQFFYYTLLQPAVLNLVSNNYVSSSASNFLVPFSMSFIAKVLSTNPVFLRRHFIRLELNQNFLQHEYVRAATRAALAKTDTIASNDHLDVPNVPYVPQIKTMKLKYEASTSLVDPNEISFSKYQDKEIQLFHLSIFGEAEQHGFLKDQLAFVQDASVTLLDAPTHHGNLLLGISNLEAGQSLSLLFQISKGSANPEKRRQQIQWSVLSDNYWKPLNDGYLLEDSTNQLLRSGIIRFIIPNDTHLNNTTLEDNLVWIKASIPEDTDAVCDLVNIHTQALTAEFANQENDLSHLLTSLPASSISKTETTFNRVKKIEQPYASFNGMPKEQQQAYYTRVSERLRHKNRAITIWDYERLVLQKFPGIYKAKCLNHSNDQTELIPGNVTMVLIPELSNQNAVNRLEPKVDLDTISQVGDFLKPRSTFFNSIHVQNPEYEQVQVNALVRFKQEFEFGYYSEVLNEEILKFLSPWTAEEKPEINFGGSLHKSEILYFIENLEFIDFITELKLYHFVDGQISNDIDQITASNSRAILVSHSNHTLNPVPENVLCT